MIPSDKQERQKKGTSNHGNKHTNRQNLHRNRLDRQTRIHQHPIYAMQHPNNHHIPKLPNRPNEHTSDLRTQPARPNDHHLHIPSNDGRIRNRTRTHHRRTNKPDLSNILPHIQRKLQTQHSRRNHLCHHHIRPNILLHILTNRRQHHRQIYRIRTHHLLHHDDHALFLKQRPYRNNTHTEPEKRRPIHNEKPNPIIFVRIHDRIYHTH